MTILHNVLVNSYMVHSRRETRAMNPSKLVKVISGLKSAGTLSSKERSEIKMGTQPEFATFIAYPAKKNLSFY